MSEVLLINGSPHAHGCTYTALSVVADELNRAGVETEIVHVGHKDIRVDGDRATMTGRSRVNAAVFGGGRHTWQLQLSFQLVKRNGRWLFTAAQASTY